MILKQAVLELVGTLVNWQHSVRGSLDDLPSGAALAVSNRHTGVYLPERTGNYLYKDPPRRASNPPLSLLTLSNNRLLSHISKCGRPHDQRAIDAGLARIAKGNERRGSLQ